MSLIDEALKRAELEAARRDGLKSGAYPWVPEHAPKPRRRWTTVAAVLVIAAAAGGGAWWLSRHPAQGPAPRSSAQAQSKIQNPKSKIDLETVEVPPPPVGMPSRVQARGPFESPKASAAPQARPTAAADVAEVHASRAEPAQPAGAPVESKPPVKKAAEGKTYIGEVKLPDGAKIELGGIVYSDANPVALINDHVLGPGAVVEEFEIVSIQPDRVELKGRGMTIFLKLK